jgi:opacity protein-like surface antigen
MRKTAILLALAALAGTPATAQVYSKADAPPEAPATGGPGSFDAARAQRNYELLLSGQKTLEELSAQEFAEVQAFDAAARARADRDKRTPRQKCLDQEIKSAGGSPSRLELRVIDLKCSQR